MNRVTSITIVAAFISAIAPAIQTPARTPPATGTAIVSGVVVSSIDPAQPVRRAIVKLSGRGELSRSAVTDDEGRFAIGFLPGGTYTLTVSKPAYLTTTFGAASIGRAGTPLVLRDAQTVADLRIPLTKGAAISGTVRDQAGSPAEGVQVFAARAELSRARQSSGLTSTVETVTTDDMGAYRIYGLAPGTYIVGALSKITSLDGITAPTREQIDTELRSLQQRGSGTASTGTTAAALVQRVSYGPVYHPSAVSAAQAATIAVGAGEDKSGTDIFLSLAPMTALEGVVLGPDGQPEPAVSLGINSIGPPLPSQFGLFPTAGLAGADAKFRYSNLAPGTWTMTARSSARVVERNPDGSLRSTRGDANEPPAGTFYWAAATINVSGGTQSVILRLRPGLAMGGHVLLDGGTAPSAGSVTQVRLSMAQDPDLSRTATAAFPNSPPAVTNPKADGSFELKGLTPGTWLLSAILPGASGPGGWWLRSAIVNGRDLLDAPIEISERDLTNIEVTLSNRHTAIGGALVGADSRPASNLMIVVLPEDRALWTSVRRVQLTQPATDGRFSFTDLPPGNYLLAAATQVPDGDWRTVEFLSALAPAGVKVTIGEGEKKNQDLRIGGR